MGKDEAHWRALEAARTSVARHGFVFNSVLGSSERIRELYNGNKKVRSKRIKRRSSLPSILTPLSPVQFLLKNCEQKKIALPHGICQLQKDRLVPKV